VVGKGEEGDVLAVVYLANESMISGARYHLVATYLSLLISLGTRLEDHNSLSHESSSSLCSQLGIRLESSCESEITDLEFTVCIHLCRGISTTRHESGN
jgi:hypothetical protein